MAHITVHTTWSTVDPQAWDALVGTATPFVEHAFLHAWEASGCASEATGWSPRPVTVHDNAGRLVAGAPAWLCSGSHGEYVFDHGWAVAAERLEIPYYPKISIGAPWTPVTGERLLVAPGEPRLRWLPHLARGIRRAARGTFGIHLLFPTEAEVGEAALHLGCFGRHHFQYHWLNRDYRSFDDFLGRFRSRARKKIRHERRAVADLEFRALRDPAPEIVELLGRFYLSTCDRYGSMRPVNEDFFARLGRTWNHRIVAMLAFDHHVPVAGAFDVIKGDGLYGRYWGTDTDRRFLHFEVCYHRGIELAIDEGLRAFEPGHGGEHKYKRGFEPVTTWSAHWLRDPRLHQGLRRWVLEETARSREVMGQLREEGPLKPPGTD